MAAGVSKRLWSWKNLSNALQCEEKVMTRHSQQGRFGERRVVKDCRCFRCKRSKTLKLLPPNFACADVICNVCGFLAQVKTHKTKDIRRIPERLIGASWNPIRDRVEASIFLSLFIVLVEDEERYEIHYLSAELQTPEMFVKRTPTKTGRVGCFFNLSRVKAGIVRVPDFMRNEAN